MFSKLRKQFMTQAVSYTMMVRTSTRYWGRFGRETWDSISFISIFTRLSRLLTAAADQAPDRWGLERISNDSCPFHWSVLTERNTSSTTIFLTLLEKSPRFTATLVFWLERMHTSSASALKGSRLSLKLPY